MAVVGRSHATLCSLQGHCSKVVDYCSRVIVVTTRITWVKYHMGKSLESQKNWKLWKWSLFARCSMHLQAWEWACFGFKQAAKGATGSIPKGNPRSTRDCKKARPSPTEAGWGGKGDVWGRMREIWQWLITFILMIQIWTPIYKQWTLAFLSQDTWWENAKQRSLINES